MAKYIVTGEFGPMQLQPGWVPTGHRKGVLAHGGKATVFNSYSAARRAIERTEKYAQEHNYNMWKTWKMRLVRLDYE